MSNKLLGGVVADSTSVSIPFLLRTAADGLETTGKVAADMTASYLRQGGVRVAITPSDLAAVNSAYSSGGVKQIDATNQPGLYRLDLPEAALAAGADWVVVSVKVTGCLVFHERFAISSHLAAAQADLDDIQARLPAALVSGRIDASVGSMAANTLTASALASDAVTEVQSGLSTLTAVGVRTELATELGRIDVAVSTRASQTSLDTVDDFLDTEIAAIKAKTDNLPPDPADASDVAGSFATVNATLATIAAYIDTEVAAIKAKTDLIPASPAAVGSAMALTSGERDAVAAALLDLANGVEAGYTPRQALRLVLSALAAKLSGAATTTVVIRDVGDTKARITAVVDASGNRSAVTLDAT